MPSGRSSQTRWDPGALPLFRLARLRDDVPAALVHRIATAGHVPESQLNYMVAEVEPGTNRFRWLVYPHQGNRVEYFQASGATGPLLEVSDEQLHGTETRRPLTPLTVRPAGRMARVTRVLTLLCAAAASLALAAPALATTQTVHSGAVSATFTFTTTKSFVGFKNLRLTITQSGNVLYDQAVSSKFCGKLCEPAAHTGKLSSVHALDLEHNGQPDVLLDLFSGGAHCCWIEQIFSFDPGTMTYVKTEHNFGDPGEQVLDLGHNGEVRVPHRG